jgi:hypothetical protein
MVNVCASLENNTFTKNEEKKVSILMFFSFAASYHRISIVVSLDRTMRRSCKILGNKQNEHLSCLLASWTVTVHSKREDREKA